MVEFALTMLIFLFLAVGSFEIARGIWTYSTVSHAAKQGVRYAMIHGADNTGVDSNGNPLSQQDVEDEVENIVKANSPGLASGDLTVVTTWTPSNVPGSSVKVRVEYPFQTLFGNLSPQAIGLSFKTEYQMIVTN